MRDVLAVDVGTSAVKAVRFGPDGAIRAAAARPLATHAPGGGRREQDPGEWWRACVALMRGLADGPPVEAVTFAGTMQNLIPMMRDGAPAGPAVLYSDGRVATARRRELEARLPDDLAWRIGNAADNAQPVFKIMEGEGAAADHLHFGAKDVLIERLCGARVVDPTTATTTGLMDLARGDWDDDVLRAAGVGRDRLPRIAAGDEVVGAVGAAAAARTGLAEGTPVVCGSGDAGAAAWGAGAEADGAAHLYVGTSGWVARASAAVPPDRPRPHYTLALPAGGGTLAVAPILSAGAALDWVAARLGRTVEEALACLDPAPPGPGAPLFLPYLAGERSPFEDAYVRGGFVNLDAGHDADALCRAAAEGVGHALRHCLEAMAMPPGEVAAVGGAFRAGALAPVLAGALGRPVRVAPHPLEATAFGAARLARRALGAADLAPPEAAPPVGPEGDAGVREARYRAHRAASEMLRVLGPALGAGAG